MLCSEWLAFSARMKQAQYPCPPLPGGRVSGERQEEPLELRPVGVTGLAGVERALLQAGRDDLEAGPVECPGGRGELRHHVRAVPPILDHLDDAADLALRPPEPLEHAGHRLAVHVHTGSSRGRAPARESFCRMFLCCPTIPSGV